MIPPGLPGPRCFIWRLIMFKPSTTTRPSFGSDCLILPRLPLSLPATIKTSSPVLTCISKPQLIANFILYIADCFKPNLQSAICNLQDLWRKRNDLHECPFAQFARHWPKNAGATRVVFLANDHRCVVVEANMRT